MLSWSSWKGCFGHVNRISMGTVVGKTIVAVASSEYTESYPIGSSKHAVITVTIGYRQYNCFTWQPSQRSIEAWNIKTHLLIVIVPSDFLLCFGCINCLFSQPLLQDTCVIRTDTITETYTRWLYRSLQVRMLSMSVECWSCTLSIPNVFSFPEWLRNDVS